MMATTQYALYKCWICYKDLIDNDYILLPREDEFLSENLSIFKNTFIIKQEGPFKFLYFTCCNKCINNYLNMYGKIFKYVLKRQITSK